MTRPVPAGGPARGPGAAPPRSGRARPAPAGAVRGGSRCVGRSDSPHGPQCAAWGLLSFLSPPPRPGAMRLPELPVQEQEG